MSSSLPLWSELNSDSNQRLQLLSCTCPPPRWLLLPVKYERSLLFRLLQPPRCIINPFYQIPLELIDSFIDYHSECELNI